MSKRKKIEQKKRWINTRAEFEWNPLKKVYEEVFNRGYWYEGELALATTPPTMEVTNWAFYNDGTESGSVIIGSVNTNPTLEVDTTYLVRFGLEETSGNSSKNTAPQLQYNHNGGGFVNVTSTSSVVQAVTNGNITDGDNTTQRITSFTFDSTNEGFDDGDGVAGGGDADLASNGMEALYSIQIVSADVADSDTIVLKIVDSNDSDADYNVYNQTDPTITVSEATEVTVTPDVGNHTNQGYTPYLWQQDGDTLIDDFLTDAKLDDGLYLDNPFGNGTGGLNATEGHAENLGLSTEYFAVVDPDVWSAGANQFIELHVLDSGEDGIFTGLLRQNTENTSAYRLQVDPETDQIRLNTLLSGTVSTNIAVLDSVGWSLSATNTLYAQIIGTSIKVVLNDVTLTEVTDASFATGNVGFGIEETASSAYVLKFLAGIATFTAENEVTPAIGNNTHTGLAPTIEVVNTITSQIGEQNHEGYAPAVTSIKESTSLPDIGVTNHAGLAPTLVSLIELTATPDVGTHNQTGYEPVVAVINELAADVSSHNISGYAPTVTVTVENTVTPDSGVINHTGYTPAIEVVTTLIPATGSVTKIYIAPPNVSVNNPHSGVFYEPFDETSMNWWYWKNDPDAQVHDAPAWSALSALDMGLYGLEQSAVANTGFAFIDTTIKNTSGEYLQSSQQAMSPDQGVKLVRDSRGAQHSEFIMLRYDVLADSGYRIWFDRHVPEIYIERIDAGDWTYIARTTVELLSANSATQTVYAQIKGTQITIEVADTEITSFADTNIATGQPAFGLWSTRSGERILSFTAYDLIENSRPPTGVINQVGYAPTITTTVNATPDTGNITQSGYAPTLEVESTLAADAGVINHEGYAPTVTVQRIAEVAPDIGVTNHAGYAPTVTAQTVAAEALPDTGTINHSGFTPVLVVDNTVTPAIGNNTHAGYAPTITESDANVATPQLGVINVSGNVVTLGVIVNAEPTPSHHNHQGFAPSIDNGYWVSPEVGSLSVIGYNPAIDQRIWVPDNPAPDGWTKDSGATAGWSVAVGGTASWSKS